MLQLTRNSQKLRSPLGIRSAALRGRFQQIRHKSKMFDKLLPEDDPQTKEFKERESRVIKEQINRGKISDALKAKTEKLFVAPPEVMLAVPENAFPDTPLQSVATSLALQIPGAFGEAPVTAVTIAFQNHGQQQLGAWHDAIRSSFGITPVAAAAAVPSPVRVLNIVFLQGWAFKLLSGVMTRATKTALAPDLVAASAMVFEPSLQTTDHWCDRLRIHNRMMGHVLLVDNTGTVRWRAHGNPAGQAELDNMVAAAKLLVKAHDVLQKRASSGKK